MPPTCRQGQLRSGACHQSLSCSVDKPKTQALSGKDQSRVAGSEVSLCRQPWGQPCRHLPAHPALSPSPRPEGRGVPGPHGCLPANAITSVDSSQEPASPQGLRLLMWTVDGAGRSSMGLNKDPQGIGPMESWGVEERGGYLW